MVQRDCGLAIHSCVHSIYVRSTPTVGLAEVSKDHPTFQHGRQLSEKLTKPAGGQKPNTVTDLQIKTGRPSSCQTI